MAVENLLREKFNCDNITVRSAEEYHCNQRDKMGFLRANVTAYYAKDRVEHFYSYLNTEQLSLFNGAVNVSGDDGVSTPAPQVGTSMAYVYVCIVVTILLFLSIAAIFTAIIATLVKKFRKKSK